MIHMSVLCGDQIHLGRLEKRYLLRETPLVQVVHRRVAIGRGPFRVLNTQIMVDPPLKLGVGANRASGRC
jgi:hypothetical protein